MAELQVGGADAEVMEQALTWCQGRAVLNSINLEDGEAEVAAVWDGTRARFVDGSAPSDDAAVGRAVAFVRLPSAIAVVAASA